MFWIWHSVENMDDCKIIIHLWIGLEIALFFKLEHFKYIALIKVICCFCHVTVTYIMRIFYIYIYIYRERERGGDRERDG